MNEFVSRGSRRAPKMNDMKTSPYSRRVFPLPPQRPSYETEQFRLEFPKNTESTFWQEPHREFAHHLETRRKNNRLKHTFLMFFALVGIGIVLGAVMYGVVGKKVKERILFQTEGGFTHLLSGAEAIKSNQYDISLEQFRLASQAFQGAGNELTWGGEVLWEVARFVPGLSRVASGKYVIDAGIHFAAAGIPLTEIAQTLSISHEAFTQGEKISLLDFLSRIKPPLGNARKELEAANEDLMRVSLDDVPSEKKEQFLKVKSALPVLLQAMYTFDKNEALIHELLGGNGPRKYIFLLQNNHELRATGGFIGSYALLEVNNGQVKRFFVDGIFNPDGQLKENIVPPKPIQKISSGWSLHDSNWFPDFPTSAEKAIFFYEKTGGPTVDGVITLTPTVMQKLLAVTGPIELKEYGLTVDADNFIPVVQEQVEVKYDKNENKPKKILADLSSLLIEKVFASQDRKTLYQVGQALVEGLNEKHILVYMRHPQTETLIDEAGWSGKIHETKKDYLSVIHSNINGYKTDGVIDETIRHKADIKADGTVIDTVSITRTHRGGNTPYDWWNRVNADYLRVYVPEGSELLSAKGATWEFPEAPLDYDKLGFTRDALVEEQERNTTIDEKSGTRISHESGKTVFGNWVYVSPQESVTVEYQYKLPFRVDVSERKNEADAYSILFQKQAGTKGSVLQSSVFYPKNWEVIWQTGPNLIPYERELKLETDLKTDVFVGEVFGVRKSE